MELSERVRGYSTGTMEFFFFIALRRTQKTNTHQPEPRATVGDEIFNIQQSIEINNSTSAESARGSSNTTLRVAYLWRAEPACRQADAFEVYPELDEGSFFPRPTERRRSFGQVALRK